MRSSASSSLLLLSALLAAPVYSIPLAKHQNDQHESRKLTPEQSQALHDLLASNLPGVQVARRSPLSVSAKPAAPKPAAAAPKTSSSSSGLGSAIAASALGGAASAAVNNIITKIESLFGRDFDSVAKRSLTEDQKAQLHDILLEHFAFAPEAQLERRLFSSAKPAAAPKPAAAAPKSSGSGVGSAIAASAIGGAAAATVSSLLSKIEGLFSRDFDDIGKRSLTDDQKAELHAILSESFPEATDIERRLFSSKPAATAPKTSSSGSGLGSAIAASALGGAASATVNNIISKIESLFGRDFDGVAKRSLTDEQREQLAAVLAESFGAGNTVERRLFSSAKPAAAPKPAVSAPKSSSSGVGSAIAASAIGGAAAATVSSLLSKIEGLFSRRDLDERALTDGQKEQLTALLAESFGAGNTVERRLFSSAKPVAAAPKSSGSGLGSAIAASAIGGAASATVSSLINKIESLFSRDLPENLKRALSEEQKSELHDILLEHLSGVEGVSENSKRGLTEQQKSELHDILLEHFTSTESVPTAQQRRTYSYDDLD